MVRKSRLLVGWKRRPLKRIAIVFMLSHRSTAVVLRATLALLIAEVLSGAWGKKTNMLGILAATLKLGGIVRQWEWLLLASEWTRVSKVELLKDQHGKQNWKIGSL